MQSFQEVLSRAPSVYAKQAHGSRSGRYGYVPTIQLIEGLADHGWKPTEATEQRARTMDRFGFTKHMVRMRNDNLPRVADAAPELLIINSHDGSSTYQMRAGFYRFVCSNGLVVGEDILPAMRIKHTSNAVRDVIDGSFRVIEELPVIVGSIEDMSRIDLDEQEKNLFAQAAMQVRFEGKPAPITEAQVLRPRRFEDEKSDLWTTFNVIEENLMRGGQRGRNANGRRQRTRAITGIDGNVSLNQALWTLAEGMKKLKLAA
jgi:hypothetical protein